jgi:hypothetical protein
MRGISWLCLLVLSGGGPTAQMTLARANPSPLVGGLIAWEPNTGEAYSVELGSTTLWRFDAGHWVATTAAMAPSVGSPQVCTWPGQGILLVGSGQTWRFDGSAWTPIATAVAPATPRALAFDAARGVAVVVAAGATPSGSEVWEFDGLGWLQRFPTTTPPTLLSMKMAWDPASQRCLLRISTGGGSAAGYYTWNGTVWTTHSIGGSEPQGFAMATAPLQSGVLFSGGFTFPLYVGGNFVWAGANGFSLPSAGAPPYRRQSVAWFDAARSRTVVTNIAPGNRGTWYWDGASWSQPSNGVQVPDGTHAFVYDSWRGRLLAFGGAAISGFEHGELWQLRDQRATRLVSGPSARAWHAIAFDSWRGRLIVFGGSRFDAGGGSYQPHFDGGGTHEWDGTTWTTVPPTTWTGVVDPRYRIDAAMAFDRQRGRTVLFGGAPVTTPTSSPVYRNDTYEWDGSTWTAMQPATVPPAIYLPRMVFDAERAQCVLFGNPLWTGGGTVWAWDGTDWNAVAMPTPPATLDYDVSRGRWMAFGLSTVWELQGGTWVIVPGDVPGGARTFDLSQGAFAGSDGLGHFTYGDAAAATLRPFADGCSGGSGMPVLHGEDAPRLGRTLPLQLARAPVGALFVGLLGADAPTWAGLVLPIDLAAAGMPGCLLHTGIGAYELRSGTTWPIVIPATAGLLGGGYRVQALVFDITAPGLGATMSTALAMRIGG